jgi:hypothetical protein
MLMLDRPKVQLPGAVMCLTGEIAYDLANQELVNAIVPFSPRWFGQDRGKPSMNISREKLLEQVASDS